MTTLIPIAEVGGRQAYGTEAEAAAARLMPGDAVRYRRPRRWGVAGDGDECGKPTWRRGIVEVIWWYESVVVKIRGGPDLHPDLGDLIGRVGPEG